MAGLYNYDCDGTLVIGGVSLNGPAWMIGADENGDGGLLSLITTTEQRGSDRLVPSATGVIAYPRRRTVTEHEFRLIVIGEVDRLGAPAADHDAQLVTNLQYLVTNVANPVTTGDGTRAATYTPPGAGSTPLTADVHVTGLRPRSYSLGWNAVWEGRLFVSVPGGSFT